MNNKLLTKMFLATALTFVCSGAYAEESAEEAAAKQKAIEEKMAAINAATSAERIQMYREQLGESIDSRNGVYASSRVVEKYEIFTYRLARLIAGAQFNAIEIVGYSGAGYANVEEYKNEAMALVQNSLQERTTVVILGGSIDGIGSLYEDLNKFREQMSEGSRLIVVGMVADGVVLYQLEGQVKGWGDVLSPHQDLLLTLPTNKGSWELIEKEGGTSRTVDIAFDLANMPNAKEIILAGFEGGDQGLREILEFNARSVGSANASKMKLALFTGYEPSPKQASKGKDKGYRATTQAALVIAENGLSQYGAEVRVISREAGFTGDVSLAPLVSDAVKSNQLELVMQKAEHNLPELQAFANEAKARASSGSADHVAASNLSMAKVKGLEATIGTREMAKTVLERVQTNIAAEVAAAGVNYSRAYEGMAPITMPVTRAEVEDFRELAKFADRVTALKNAIQVVRFHIDNLNVRIQERAAVTKIK